MKKNIQLITFVLFTLVFLSFVIYGQIRANEARKNAEAAKVAQEEAMQMAEMARQQAEDAAAQARMVEAHALNQAAELTKVRAELKECQSK